MFQPCQGCLKRLAPASALARQGKLGEAAGARRQVQGGEKRYEVAAAWDRGLEYTEQGMLNMANAGFERALAVDPANAEAFANLGAFYHNTGKPDEALGLLERAAELDPAVAKTHRYVSLIYQPRSRNDEAERERAILRTLTG